MLSIKCLKYYLLLLIVHTCYAVNNDLDNKLQQILNKTRSQYNISAMSLSVAVLGEQIKNYTSGTLSIQDKTLVSADNLYQVASITKNFTAVLILQLVEQNKISLDDQLSQYLPQYPKWKSITIRQLLNHTSGCYDYIDSPNWWPYVAQHKDKIWQASELLNIAYKHSAYFAPGRGWHYSNTNYILAGLIIEKVSGQSLETQMNRLLQLAKLNNSYYLPYPYPKNIKVKMVHGYYQNSDETDINGSWGQGAAALVSTPSQIVLWVQKLFAGKILTTSTLTIMQNSVTISDGKEAKNFEIPTYGLGMFSMNTPEGVIWFTPGLTSGYRSLWAYMPCDGIIFEYSIANGLIGKMGVHKQMLQDIILTLKSSKTIQQQIVKYRTDNKIPAYCNTQHAREWSFIKL